MNVNVIPSRRKLEQIDDALSSKNKFVVRQHVLLEPLRLLRGKYDTFSSIPPLTPHANGGSACSRGVVSPIRHAGSLCGCRLEGRPGRH